MYVQDTEWHWQLGFFPGTLACDGSHLGPGNVPQSVNVTLTTNRKFRADQTRRLHPEPTLSFTDLLYTEAHVCIRWPSTELGLLRAFTLVVIAVPTVGRVARACKHALPATALSIGVRRGPAGIIAAKLPRLLSRYALTVPAAACGAEVDVRAAIVAHLVLEALFVVVERPDIRHFEVSNRRPAHLVFVVRSAHGALLLCCCVAPVARCILGSSLCFLCVCASCLACL
jgi:hypothetical protein